MDQTAAREARITGRSGTALRFRRRIAASPERVFAAWTRPEALKLWWCPDGWLPDEIAVDLRVGGSYRIVMRRESGDRQDAVGVYGRFLEIVAGARLVYTWRWDGAFPDMPETRITVEFRAVDGATEIALVQDELPLSLCTRQLGGWLEAVGRMEQMLLSGGLLFAPAVPRV